MFQIEYFYHKYHKNVYYYFLAKLKYKVKGCSSFFDNFIFNRSTKATAYSKFMINNKILK